MPEEEDEFPELAVEEDPPLDVELVPLLEEASLSEEAPVDEEDEDPLPPQPAKRRALTLKANKSEDFFMFLLPGTRVGFCLGNRFPYFYYSQIRGKS